MDSMTADRLRRRYGYRIRTPRPDPVRDMIERAGGRLTDLNRGRPGGLAYTSCPDCGEEQGFWTEPDGTWSRTCGCRPRAGGPFELLALLIARTAA